MVVYVAPLFDLIVVATGFLYPGKQLKYNKKKTLQYYYKTMTNKVMQQNYK